MENVALQSLFPVSLPNIKIGAHQVAITFEGFDRSFDIPPGCHVGIEYEIEEADITRNYDDSPQTAVEVYGFGKLWSAVPDGSLRGIGVEFVSRPIEGDNITTALAVLRHELNYRYQRARPSHRTGIHIHVNSNDLNVPQLFAWIALYQVFERSLYKFSGSREKNIYCLPTWAWSKNLDVAIQRLPRNQQSAVEYLTFQSHKYAGMNTLPISRLGTLEFRQMQTVLDFNKIGLWIEFLTKIKLYAAGHVKDLKSLEEFYAEISELNTNSEYANLFGSVIGANSSHLCVGDWAKDTAEGVIQVKETFVQYQRAKSKPIPPAPAPAPDLLVMRISQMGLQEPNPSTLRRVRIGDRMQTIVDVRRPAERTSVAQASILDFINWDNTTTIHPVARKCGCDINMKYPSGTLAVYDSAHLIRF